MTREVALVFLGLSVLGCLYIAAAVVVTLLFRRRESVSLMHPEPVTIFKPLCGDEPGLYERLRSFCTQRYPAPVQVVLGVQAFDDPALGVARRLAQAYPDQVQIVVDERPTGANFKVSNLVNMAKVARHDVFVLSDSDIEVGPDYLRKLTAALQDRDVGAVTLLYYGIPSAGLWSRLCAMAIDATFLPNVLVGMKLGLAEPCFGSTIAIRRQTMAAIGGFGAFVNQLADDYAIGAAVRRLGLKVAVPGFVVGHVCREDSLARLWLQELRWARTVRTVDPTGYVGTTITHPFALALIGTVLGDSQGLWFAAAALACRWALCLAVEHRFGLAPHPFWLLPLRDIMLFAVFVSSFVGRSVHWRDQDYDVTRDGALRTEEAAR
jgi:ceramide glucosyltransferase